MKKLPALLAAGLAICLTACAASNGFSGSETLSKGVSRAADDSVTYHYGAVTEAPTSYNNFANTATGFSLKLFRNAYADGVTAISPANAYLQLGLLANGVKGSTRTEILLALGAELDLDSLNACCSYFKSRLQETGKAKENDKTAPMTLSGTLFAPEQAEVRRAFLQLNADYYDDEVIRYNYETGGEKLRAYLGDSFTLGKEDSLTSYTKLSLNDAWLNPSLQSEEYTMHSGAATGVLKYTAQTPLKALFIMPESGDLAQYVKTFDSVEYSKLLDSVDVTKREKVSLPSFQTRGQMTELSSNLARIGLYTLFGEDADFGALSFTEELTLSAFYDTTPSLTVTAQGITENAAATPDAASGNTADTPFLFLLVDNETNLPIYIAAVA